MLPVGRSAACVSQSLPRRRDGSAHCLLMTGSTGKALPRPRLSAWRANSRRQLPHQAHLPVRLRARLEQARQELPTAPGPRGRLASSACLVSLVCPPSSARSASLASQVFPVCQCPVCQCPVCQCPVCQCPVLFPSPSGRPVPLACEHKPRGSRRFPYRASMGRRYPCTGSGGLCLHCPVGPAGMPGHREHIGQGSTQATRTRSSGRPSLVSRR
jgi:hypothetical protein